MRSPAAATGHRPALRVLQVAPRYLPDLGGIETHVHEVSTRLATYPDIRLAVAATDRFGEYPSCDISGEFPVIRRRAWPKQKDYYFAPGLADVIGRGGWDVVHVQGIHTLVPVVAMLAARRAGIPYVVTFHTGGHSSRLRVAARTRQWRTLAPLLKRAAQLVAVSRFEQKVFADATGMDESRIAVIRNGGSLPEPAAGVRRVPGRIISSGRLERYKGHHRVIEALPSIRQQVPDAHLHILGAGPYETELRKLAVAHGVSDLVTIRLVAPQDRQAMARSLAEASVFAALSDYEAHPVAVMEALALGVPVVGYDVAGVADLVEDGFVAGIQPGASPLQAAQVITAAMVGQRRLPYTQFPTWDAAAQQLATVYRSVAMATPHGEAALELVAVSSGR